MFHLLNEFSVQFHEKLWKIYGLRVYCSGAKLDRTSSLFAHYFRKTLCNVYFECLVCRTWKTWRMVDSLTLAFAMCTIILTPATKRQRVIDFPSVITSICLRWTSSLSMSYSNELFCERWLTVLLDVSVCKKKLFA